jgi:parvulin-like peptidyl-prolyl isomerase
MPARPRHTLLAVVILAALAVVALAAACGGSSAPDASPSADHVVATVNGRPVRESAVQTVRAERRLVSEAGTRAGAVREAIDRELVRQEAERLGVAPDAGEVSSRLADITKQAGGDARLAATLERARMTTEQLRQSLEDGVLREALSDAKYQGVAASAAAVRAYYDRHPDVFRQAAAVHLGAIIVSAERIAESAIARLQDGHPFDEVARQFSSDPESKANGGDLGWVLEGSLPPALRKAAAGLAKGEVSAPVAAFGRWYVLKLVDRRDAKTSTFADVRERLGSELTKQKRARALAAWLAEARKGDGVTQP